MHLVRAAEESYVDVFACHVAEDDTGEDSLYPSALKHRETVMILQVTNRRDGKPPGDLAHGRTQRRDGGRLDVGPYVAIDDHGTDEVQDGVDDLQHG